MSQHHPAPASAPPPGWPRRLARRLRAQWPTGLALLAVVLGAHLWHTRHLPSGVLPDATVLIEVEATVWLPQ